MVDCEWLEDGYCTLKDMPCDDEENDDNFCIHSDSWELRETDDAFFDE